MPQSDAASLKIYLLDMGTEKYGDCLLVQLGDRTILIDGGHLGDARRRGDTPSIPEQLESLLGHAAPFAFDLLVVTHCHADHIGCLPTLVANGDLTATWALVADEKLGFGRGVNDTVPDAAYPANGLAAALREEDHSDLPDDELNAFLADAATLEERYIAMLGQLESNGARLFRYGKDSHTDIETEFQDFGLKVLGPTKQHLAVCAQAIAHFSDQADNALRGRSDATNADIVALYRSMTPSADEVVQGAADMPGKGAALNNQSIVLKLEVGQATALLAGDMQFAKAETTGLSGMMKTLRNRVKSAGPYEFIKFTHHTSYNGLDDSVLSEWSATKRFAHTGGLNDAGHPDPGVLQLLEQHTQEIQWARTDRNGVIGVSFTSAGAKLAISEGELNDASPNGDTTPGQPAETAEPPGAAAPVPQLRVLRSPSGVTEVSASAKLGPDVTRLTVTFDIQRGGPIEPSGPDPRRPRPVIPAPPVIRPTKVKLASGRALPPLLFVTNTKRLSDNLGAQEAMNVIQTIRDAGQALYDVQNPANPYVEVRGQLSGAYKGVVVVGGYDVLPSMRLDVLPPSLRQTLGSHTYDDADNFIVWSDEAYGDRDGDMLGEFPVSRIPDGRSPKLIYGALSAGVPTNSASRFGVRNVARPFAQGPHGVLPGNQPLLISEPASPQSVGAGAATAPHVYLMLHGSDTDATHFWGEDDNGVIEAIDLRNVPPSIAGVILAGCCWGALISTTTAAHATGAQPPAPRAPDASLALSWLQAGARAFVGCTGTHYSPTTSPYNYFGGPMHTSFWKRYTQGETPAQALFGAKLDYLKGLPHGQTSPNGQAIEFKILKQFTCLGLGW